MKLKLTFTSLTLGLRGGESPFRISDTQRPPTRTLIQGPMQLIKKEYFFTSIPCTYTSSLLDGILYTWIHKITQIVVSGSILFLPPYSRREKKNIWSELKLNPGLLAPQATALTT